MPCTKECQNQLLAGTTVFFNEIIMGFGYGWVAPTLRLLHLPTNTSLLHNPHQSDDNTSNLTISSEEASWIASLCDFGRFFGPLIVSPLLSLIGRKGVLALCSTSFFCTWIIVAFTRSVTSLYLARLMFGIAVGMNDVTCAIYLVENFKPHFRGIFGSVCTTCFYGGCLIEYVWVNYLSYDMVAYVNTVISFLALANIAFSTESAQYLITKKRYAKALKNFAWLHGEEVDSERMVQEFEALKRYINEEDAAERTVLGVLKTPQYRRLIVQVLIFCLLMASTGAVALQNFVSISFREGPLTANEFTILFGALLFFSAMASSSVIERVDRHTILTVSFLISAATHGCTATLFFLEERRVEIWHLALCIFATISVYSMMYSSGILPIFYTFRGEVLPTHMRPVGNAIAVLGHSLSGFLTTKMFLLVAVDLGMYWNFIFYLGASIAGAIFSHFFMTETRGKSLEEIEDSMKKKNRKNSNSSELAANRS